uniref:Uncharacterized protein n=1 Tax=Glossina palpalis gambiensis TaxID=67801 RepID=A0A1B0BG45_9MUSC
MYVVCSIISSTSKTYNKIYIFYYNYEVFTSESFGLELNQSTLYACWELLLRQMVQRGNFVASVEAEFNRIISVTFNLEGDEFSIQTNDDVRELFGEQAWNEEEVIELVNTFTLNYAYDSESMCSTTTIPHSNLADLQEGIALAEKFVHFCSIT